MDAWRVEVRVREDLPDPAGDAARHALTAAGLELSAPVRSHRGYLLGADLGEDDVRRFTSSVLADPICETATILAPGEAGTATPGEVRVVPRPGVTDNVAHSVQKALVDSGMPEVMAGTYRGFRVGDDIDPGALRNAAATALANDVIQDVTLDGPPAGLPGAGGAPDLDPHEIVIRSLDDAALEELSKTACLALTVREMRTIQTHYEEAGREPTQSELETIAQTWSEHCKHKTLTGKIRFGDEIIDNLLKSEIARVTNELDRDFCVSVFVDNAGVITFDDEDCVCIKVETHNHPSAIEPFGGAGTGVGGVIRDVLGTGLAARPVASTDIFCVAPLDMKHEDVPEGCMHPQRILRGVVAGVRDYGNPMGIPTVHGAVHFDEDFVGNPLVYVGNVGVIPRNKVAKKPNPGDAIVSIGGRTGRDGIHGATFSSLELHTESESVSSGAVQIGDPITERKAMDAVLRGRDEGLFSAVTDCGAGGYSSAVGEMAEGLGATVQLETVPLKYEGLAPWEIWISEAQERMVVAVPQEHVARVLEICDEEDVEGTVLGHFEDTGRLVLKYGDVVHGDMDLAFLHDGLPEFEREAHFVAKSVAEPNLPAETDHGQALLNVLADPNVASKEWIVRQYDHEVQAGSAGKPLVGVRNDGPADAAVIAPKLNSERGIVLSSGLNPRYSRIDPAAMAECAIDEAMRNIVAAGGDPEHTAVLDNYCWGNCADPQRLGELVVATRALCHVAETYRTPFVSGKDSLNNEFNAGDRTISIPGCILVTAMSVIPDVKRTITTDFKTAGNKIAVIGVTKRELGGSVYWKTRGELGACVPRVDAESGKEILDSTARAIASHAIVSCHDLSEGGLAAAAAEMSIGGRLGCKVDLGAVVADDALSAEELMFSESQSRFLIEVPPDKVEDVEANLFGVAFSWIGEVDDSNTLTFDHGGQTVADIRLADCVHAFKHTLDLDGTMTEATR